MALRGIRPRSSPSKAFRIHTEARMRRANCFTARRHARKLILMGRVAGMRMPDQLRYCATAERVDRPPVWQTL